MDISTIVRYEQLFELELKHPTTDEPLGITFQIRSAGSEKAKEVQRKHTDSTLKRLMRQKTLTSAKAEAEALEKAASYIASWDWGSNTFAGKDVPEYSMQAAIDILDQAPWIFDRVTEAATSLENFSTASETT